MPGTYGGFSYGSQPYAGPPVMSTATFPDVSVEVGFGAGALDEPVATWTDISKYVTAWSTRRGRQHELGQFDAGTATITLSNRDGRFSPFNTASPYNPNIVPATPIRIRAVWNGVTYDEFRGVVEAWPMKWASASDSEVTVQAVDVTKLLNLKKATTLSQYPATVLADSPYLYWRLGDPPGSGTAADSSGNGRTGTAGTIAGGADPPFFGADGAIIADVDTSFDCGTATGQITRTVALNQNSVSIEVWAQQRSLPSSGIEGIGAAAALASLSNSAADQQINIQINNSFTITDSGVPFVHVDTGTGVISDLVSQVRVVSTPWHIPVTIKGTPLVIKDSRWHHYVVTSNGTTIKLYVDGVIQLQRALAASAVLNVFTVGGFDGTIDDVALYSYALTEAQAIAHYNAGAAPRANELSGNRISAYLDAIVWPAGLRRIDAGNSPLQPANRDAVGRPVLANMQTAADSEDGDLFIDAAGKVTFFDRHRTSISPYSSVSLILGDSGASPEEPYLVDSADVALDDTDVWSEVSVTPDGLGAQIAADATSQARYGKRTLSISTIGASATEAAARAAFDLARFKDPAERVRSISFTPMSDPTMLFGPALGFDLLTRVEVRRRPMDGAASLFDQVALIEGIEHRVTKGSWLTKYRLSSTDAYLNVAGW